MGDGDKDEEIKRYKLVVPKQSWDVKYSIENIVYNTAITMYGVRWVLKLFGGDHFVNYKTDHYSVHLKLI